MTKMITSGVLFSLGDAITQIVIDKKSKFDFNRNFNLFFVGTIYIGPFLHVWYSKILPSFGKLIFKESTKKSSKVFTFTLADQLLFTPINLAGFFIINALVERFTL